MKSNTHVDPFKYNLSIYIGELNRAHQDDNLQDSDDEQSESSAGANIGYVKSIN